MSAVAASRLKALFQRRRRAPRAYPLNLLILTLAASLVVLSAGSIGEVSYLSANKAAHGLSQEIIDHIADETKTRINAYLQPVEPALDLARHFALADPRYGFLKSGPPTEAEGRARAALLLQFLRVNQASPQFTMFFYGDRWGHFWAAYRVSSDRYQIIHRWVRNGRTLREVYRVGQDDQTWLPDSERATNFDCRRRPWYINARVHRGFTFTQPYRFNKDLQPGLTASLPMLDANRKFRGAFGADLELQEVDTFLKTVSRNTNTVYVLSEENPGSAAMVRLLASSRAKSPPASPPAKKMDVPSEMLAVSERYKLPLAVNSDDPLLREVGKRFTVWKSDTESRTRSEEFRIGGVRYLGASMPLPTAGQRWTLAIVVPRDDVLSEVDLTIGKAIRVFLAILVLAFVGSQWGASTVARPLRALRDQMQRVGDFDLSDEPFKRSRVLEVCQAGTALDHMKSSLRSFRKYVPADLVREYLSTGTEAKLGGQLASVTIFFADLVGFSGVAEQVAPDVLVEMMADYLQDMEQIIRHHGGLLDKISGDAVMALFGPPIRPLPHHAERAACAAAIEYVARSQRADRRPDIHARGIVDAGIGIHTGEVLVGNIGSRERMAYTAMGDAVNVASRLEGLTRVYQVRILVSEATYRAAADHFEFRLLDTVAVKGRRGSISIYELISASGALPEAAAALRERYSAGLALYRECRWEEAVAEFARALTLVPEDGPSRLFLDRCREFERVPPAEDWGGVYTAPFK